jgi:predicted membrane GTPase involved in stress response
LTALSTNRGENVTVDLPEESQNSIMEQIGIGKGDLTNMVPDGKGVRRYNIPAAVRSVSVTSS